MRSKVQRLNLQPCQQSFFQSGMQNNQSPCKNRNNITFTLTWLIIAQQTKYEFRLLKIPIFFIKWGWDEVSFVMFEKSEVIIHYFKDLLAKVLVFVAFEPPQWCFFTCILQYICWAMITIVFLIYKHVETKLFIKSYYLTPFLLTIGFNIFSHSSTYSIIQICQPRQNGFCAFPINNPYILFWSGLLLITYKTSWDGITSVEFTITLLNSALNEGNCYIHLCARTPTTSLLTT